MGQTMGGMMWVLGIYIGPKREKEVLIWIRLVLWVSYMGNGRQIWQSKGPDPPNATPPRNEALIRPN